MEIKGVTESSVQHLRGLIITGELEAGEKINETQLAASLGVSRPPLREALRVLENENLVVSIPRKWTYVTKLSSEDLEEVYRAREMLECYSIELLKANNVKDLPKVESAMELAWGLSVPLKNTRDEKLGYLNAMADFHMKLVESTDNKWVVHFYNAISSQLARYQFIYLYIPGSTKVSLAKHREILDLINKGSFARAKKELKAHIGDTFERLKRSISQREIKEEKLSGG